MSVSELTKQLIALPSFDDGDLFEKPMSDFLAAYIKEHLPWLTVTLQEAAPNRFNVFAKDVSETTLLVVDQIDTVPPGLDWATDPLTPVEKNGKIYGLGASDSKGNVAAFLTALKKVGPTRGLALLLYVDEEAGFLGMKHFIESDLATTISPDRVLCIDGNGSSLGLACRGVTEFDVEIWCDSGHSADLNNKGAIRRLMEAFSSYQDLLLSRDVSEVRSSAHIARIESGFLLDDKSGGKVFGDRGNQVPNYAFAKIESRMASEITWEDTQEVFSTILSQDKDVSFTLTPIHVFQGYQSDPSQLADVKGAIEAIYNQVKELNPSTFGYLDFAMLKQIYPDTTIFSFGLGEPGVNHAANEYVTVDALEAGVLVYEQLITGIQA